jgi:DNA-binding transcriptional LysR family regulator
MARKNWRDLDSICRKVLPNLATLELIGLHGKSMAADELKLRLPSLLKRIEPAEKFLGGKLVNRGKGGRLTELGENWRQLWADIEAPLGARRKVADAINSNQEFRIAILQSLFHESLKAEYETQTKGMSILVTKTVLNGSVYDELREGWAEVAIGYAPEQLDETRFKKSNLPKEPMCLVVSEQCAMKLIEAFPEIVDEGASRMHILLAHRTSSRRAFYTMPEDAPMRRLVVDYLTEQLLTDDGEGPALEIGLNELEPRISVKEALHEISEDRGISILPSGSVKDMRTVSSFRLQNTLYRRLVILYPKRPRKMAEQKVLLKIMNDHAKNLP